MYNTLAYKTWAQFKSESSKDICSRNSFPNKRYIFRGQRNPSWSLITSFDRFFGKLDYNTRKSVQETLYANFKNYCFELLDKDKIHEYDEISLLSLGQHYGLPTRLLDWTYSIYIAAFFAFATKQSDNSDHACIWVIDTSHEIWNANYGVNLVISRIVENQYQKLQQGLFTLNESPNLTLEDFVNSCKDRCDVDGALNKIIIPFSERYSILNDLSMMGINHRNLFSGFEGCAQTALLDALLKYKLN